MKLTPQSENTHLMNTIPRYAAAVFCVAAFSQNAHAQTKVRAWHAKGQTWVVWVAGALPPFAFSVYRSTNASVFTTQGTLTRGALKHAEP